MVHLSSSAPAPWHRTFLAMLPQIITRAKVAFRDMKPDAKAEAVQEVTCNALKAFIRLVELGKTDIAYATALAKYAVAQYRCGRRIGRKLNVHDISSRYCQVNRNVIIERLDRFDDEHDQWQEAVLVDTRSTPVPDIVSFRIDFSDWLGTLKRRDRRIAESLAIGNCTGDVAKKHRVSAGRVSQLRRELAESWNAYIGKEPVAA